MAQLWMFGLPSDRVEAPKLLKELGCSTVTVGYDKGAVDAITDQGMRAHVVMGAYSFERDLRKGGLLARRLDGRRVVWFGSGCPNNPKIRNASLNRARDAASVEGVEAVVLDGIRFASPGEGIDTFLSCFCDVCRRKSAQLGHDMREMEASLRGLVKSIGRLTPSQLHSVGGWRSPMDLFDLLIRFPGILGWLRFRADCVCEHVTDIRKAMRSVNPSCKLGAYLFTPSLSYLVGQDYRRLGELLDYVEPMIYRTGEGVACLNHEVAEMATDIYERGDGLDQVEVQRFLFGLLGLDAEPEISIGRLKEGMSYRSVESEVRRAARTEEIPKLVPILYLNDPSLRESVAGALRAGIEAISFFHFYEGAEKAIRIADEIIKGSTS